MRPTLTILAPAKLNLALAVGPAGVDGMHPICSWMTTVTLYDELHLARLDEGDLSRYAIEWHDEARRRSPIDWSIQHDLAVRAHGAVQEHIGRDLPLQLRLRKRIPVGGGLGGGSSNAAAMLHGVNRLFSLGLCTNELARVGSELGSDVPFLVHGGSAIVEGLGERVTPLVDSASAPIHAVVIFPAVACPTGDVYRLFDELGTGAFRPDAVHALVRASSSAPRPDAPFNDLARAALRIAPSLRDDLARIAELARRPAHVSGSGSSLFVLCDDALHAEHLAAAIADRLHLPAVAVQSTSADL